jgi:serine/threonine-protein kinase
VSIAAGQVIGNYRVLQQIGTGGMGAVFLAEHPQIGKKVALKVIHRELAHNREVVGRFFNEARSVNRIGNEHIVEIHDFGVTPNNDHFYIMEYLEGHTLASVIAKERVIDVMRSLHIGAQIASALSAAHVAGVIHRDLKPDNIMLMRRLGEPDFVKVLDFGLAKMFAAGASSVKTAAGVLLGTPQYMSPEACESKPSIDHRTDIYALGVLLFQMMTGALPFNGESMGEILVKQVTALPPAPRGFNPAIPPSVEQVLLRCLAKPVDARFQSMSALRDALLDPEAYLRASPPIAPARSVAPGEAKFKAQDVIAHAAAMQAQKQGPVVEPWQVAPTIMGDELPAAVQALKPGPVMPALAQPTAPNPNTMRIGTPVGYSSRPPRKIWPLVLVLGLVLGLVGGAFAVAWVGRGEGVAATISDSNTASPGDAAAPTTVASDSAVARGSAVAAGSAPSPGSASPGSASQGSASAPPDRGSGSAAIPPKPPMARLTIDSTPPKASVFGPDGELLGKTRLELEWPISKDAVAFEIRLSGYRTKPKRIVVGGNTTIGVELEKLRGSGRTSGSGTGSAGRRGDGLIRPGD